MNTPKLKLYTARHGHYAGSGALDITRDTADRYPDALGAVFAPPRWLLNVALGVPDAASIARRIFGCVDIPRRNSPRAFVRWYEARYREAMGAVLTPLPSGEPTPALDALFSFAEDEESDGSVTVLCFCENCAACHRVMFARYVVELWSDRVSYEGERQSTGADQ